jgi:hypothetical protein
MERTIVKMVLVIIAVVAFATASFAEDPGPKACVKNNAGVVLKVGQDLKGWYGPIALGESVKVYSDFRLFLLCSSMFGEYSRCSGEGGQKDYHLKDGQTLVATGTIFSIHTHITDNTCK